MKVYLEEKDIGRRITTYHDGLGTQQGLYVFGKDKIEVHSLADYTKQVRKEVVDDLAISLLTGFSSDAEFTRDEIINWLQKVKDQIQGETK